MALVTLQAIFQDAFPAYEQRHALPAHVRRACPHPVPDGCPWWSYPGMPRRPRRPCLVQLVPASFLSPMRVSPD